MPVSKNKRRAGLLQDLRKAAERLMGAPAPRRSGNHMVGPGARTLYFWHKPDRTSTSHRNSAHYKALASDRRWPRKMTDPTRSPYNDIKAARVARWIKNHEPGDPIPGHIRQQMTADEVHKFTAAVV